MDITNTLRGEAFRPLATIVAPGALALVPWFGWVQSVSGDARELWQAHPVATGVLLFIGSLAMGFVFENIGARIEQFLDKRLTASRRDHLDIWHRYLALTLSPEPVGQRYLRTILFRFKFELAILGSLPFHLAGWLLFAVSHDAALPHYASTVLLILAVAFWFGYEAFDSAKLLADLRRRLVYAYEKQPPALPPQDERQIVSTVHSTLRTAARGATVLAAIATTVSVCVAVSTYHDATRRSALASSVELVQEYVRLAIAHPELAEYPADTPITDTYEWFAVHAFVTAEAILRLTTEPAWRSTVRHIILQHGRLVEEGRLACGDYSEPFMAAVRAEYPALQCAD